MYLFQKGQYPLIVLCKFMCRMLIQHNVIILKRKYTCMSLFYSMNQV